VPGGRERGGGIGEHQAAGFGPAEEGSQDGEPPCPACRPPGQECFQVGCLGGGPVGLGPLLGQEAGQVPEDGQLAGDRGVSAGTGPGLAGALLPGGQDVA